MSLRMFMIYVKVFIEKFKMKYITHEMVNEDIFPLCEGYYYQPTTTETIDELLERLGK